MLEKCLVTYQQKKLILYEKLHPGETEYNMVQAVKLEGKVDKKQIINAVNRLYQEEKVLRIRYEENNGVFYQVITEPECILSKHEEIDEITLWGKIEEEKKKPFQIFEEKIIRCFLFSISPNKCVLIIVLHHSICDGWSLKVLYDKILNLYLNKNIEISNDYIIYSHEQGKESLKKKSNKDYWTSYLKEVNTIVDFPFDFSKNKISSFEGGCFIKYIPENLTLRIEDYCRQNQITPFVFFYGAFCYLMHVYSNQKQITVGVPFANRLDKKWNETLGYFVNVIPIKVDFEENKTVKLYLKEIYLSMIRSISKTDVNLEKDYNIAFAFHNFDITKEIEIENIKISPFKIHNGKSKFDLELSVQMREQKYICEWEYAKLILKENTIIQLQNHYQNILQSFLGNDGQTVSEIKILTENELEQQKNVWNKTDKIYKNTNLVDFFKEAVKKYKKYDAIKYDEKVITYETFDHKSNYLASMLNIRGLGKGSIVAIQFDRSIEMILSIYAIIKIGGAYLPIAMDTPKNRIQYILENSEAEALLKYKKTTEKLNCQVIEVNEEKLLQSNWEQPEYIEPEDAAYVIYTSGSTGEPKGVINTHAGICNRIHWMQDEFNLLPGYSVLQKTPYTFDVSVWEFFWPLLFGGKIVIAKPEGHKDAGYLIDAIVKEEISFVHFVPSMLSIFIKNAKSYLCMKLKCVICSGEVLNTDLVKEFYNILDVPLANLYGPTEAAVDVSCYRLNCYDGETIIPIGKPISNIRLYKLNDKQCFTPYNVPGELYISGIGLAKGYLNNKILTKEKFLEDSSNIMPSNRMYKTGDLVKYDEYGNLIYLNRIDNQVKLNGQRVELGEIEERIKLFSEIEDAVVIVNKNNVEEQLLIGFYTSDITIDKEQLVLYLKKYLMGYMIPKIFFQIDNIPLSNSGKVDKNTLTAFYVNNVKTTYSAPVNFIEEGIVQVFEEVLETNKIGREDDFFLIGGNSLRVADIITKLYEKFGWNVSYDLLLNNPLVKDFAKQIGMKMKQFDVQKEQINLYDETMCNIEINHNKEEVHINEINVLLSGANGFLGVHLLRELIEKKKVKNLYCLIRASDEDTAWSKLITNMKSLKLWKSEYKRKIHVLVGDLEKKKLGLQDDTIQMLQNKVNVICHNGANVNFSIPYQRIRDTNVNGTIELLKVFGKGIKKKLIYISTFSVFSGDSYKKNVVREDSYPEDINNLSSGYVQSKMVCENIIKKYQEEGEEISIVRLGRLIGDQSIRIQNVDMISRLLKLCRDMKAFPDIENRMDMLPVDLASRAIGYLLAEENKIKRVYHLINPKFISLKRIGDILINENNEIRRMEWDKWYSECMGKVTEGSELAKSVIILLKEKFKEEMSEYQYDMKNADDLYKVCNICLPEQEELINNLLYNGGNENEE